MILVYKLALYAYACAIRLASFFNPKAAKFFQGRKALFDNLQAALSSNTKKVIWFHCASLGEFEQARPLIEKIKNEQKDFFILLSFFSPSGYEHQQKYAYADYVCYLPLDIGNNAARFVNIIQAQCAIFIKYELWIGFIDALHQAQVPFYLIDAVFRPNQIFFKPFAAFYRKRLCSFHHIFVQDAASLKLLESLSYNQCSVAGDTRYDRVWDIAQIQYQEVSKIEKLAHHYKLFIAGSTWPKDVQLIKQFSEILNLEWKLILVPHEINATHLEQIEHLWRGQLERWSQETNDFLNHKVLVIDRIGILSKIYRYAHFVWIGGGMDSNGIHNAIEAAVYGVPVAFGPNYIKFLEAQDLVQSGAAFSLEDAKQLQQLFQKFNADEASYIKVKQLNKSHFEKKTGATNIIYHYLLAKNCFKIA